MPIGNAAMDERTFVEWDKDDLDALGILKIDVLGLGMLSCLRKALDLVQRHYPEACPGRSASFLPPPEGGGRIAERSGRGVNCDIHQDRPPPQPSPLQGEGARRAWG